MLAQIPAETPISHSPFMLPTPTQTPVTSKYRIKRETVQLTAEQRKWKSLLNSLMRNTQARDFLEVCLFYICILSNMCAFQPVDPIKLGIPQYFSIITHPMDFKTMMSKLNSGKYTLESEFVADMRLVFENALKFNPPGDPVANSASRLSFIFEQKLSQFNHTSEISSPVAAIVEPAKSAPVVVKIAAPRIDIDAPWEPLDGLVDTPQQEPPRARSPHKTRSTSVVEPVTTPSFKKPQIKLTISQDRLRTLRQLHTPQPQCTPMEVDPPQSESDEDETPIPILAPRYTPTEQRVSLVPEVSQSWVKSLLHAKADFTIASVSALTAGSRTDQTQPAATWQRFKAQVKQQRQIERERAVMQTQLRQESAAGRCSASPEALQSNLAHNVSPRTTTPAIMAKTPPPQLVDSTNTTSPPPQQGAWEHRRQMEREAREKEAARVQALDPTTNAEVLSFERELAGQGIIGQIDRSTLAAHGLIETEEGEIL